MIDRIESPYTSCIDAVAYDLVDQDGLKDVALTTDHKGKIDVYVLPNNIMYKRNTDQNGRRSVYP